MAVFFRSRQHLDTFFQVFSVLDQNDKGSFTPMIRFEHERIWEWQRNFMAVKRIPEFLCFRVNKCVWVGYLKLAPQQDIPNFPLEGKTTIIVGENPVTVFSAEKIGF
jgi:hypothetical protein